MLENSLKLRQTNLVDRDYLDSNKVRIYLVQMYLAMRKCSKALHHLNIAKEVQNRASNIFVLGGADINFLIAEVQEHMK